MAINVTVLNNGGLLPDIILLTQFHHHRGTRLNAMKRLDLCSLSSHLNILTFFPLTGECSEGLDAFRLSFKKQKHRQMIRFAAVLTFVLQRFSEDAAIHAELVHLKEPPTSIGPEPSIDYVRRAVWVILYTEDV